MLAEAQLKQLKSLTGNLSTNELIWAQGFLAGVLSIKGENKPVVAEPVVPVAPVVVKKVSVLYGTETGNSKSLATRFVQKAKAVGQAAKLTSLDQYRVEDLAKEENVLFIISTHGEGEPPASAKKFFDYIYQQAISLNKLNFAVLALGDSAYPLFCKAGEDVDNQLQKLGATRIQPIQKCDVDYEAAANFWIDEILKNLQALPESQNRRDGQLPVSTRNRGRKFYKGTIRTSINLNGAGSNKETYHIEIGCDEKVDYQPGDSLGIIPENRKDIVHQILKLTGANPAEVITAAKTQGTIQELLTKHLNICHLSTSNLKSIAAITGHAIPDIRMDLVDILRIYPIKVLAQFTEIVKILSPIAPRLYSISSAPAAHDQEVHITVSQNTFRANDELKFGLCSRFIGNMEEGEVIEFYIHENKLFKLPAPEQDLIMIGPGSGIAAMRSFLYEREATGSTGRNWLFFGDQHFTTDFLYQTEIQKWLETGTLTKLSVAFSRDQEEKVYVQHKMAALKTELYSWLEDGACLYVSGSRNPMSTDVETALLKILQGEGNQSESNAKTYLDKLKEENRYLLDVY